jgi:UPF0271 protein
LVQVDINCDLGESFGRFKVGYDNEIMPYITSANVACGFHAGDPNTMASTIRLAKKRGVAVGAHPGYPDLMGLGRREMKLTQDEISHYIIYQVGALDAFTKVVGVRLQHVKPHGAMYNAAAHNRDIADAIIEAISSLNSKLVLFALANSTMAREVADAGLRVASEVFADRAYNSDGSLVSRSQQDSVIEDPKIVGERAVMMVKEKKVRAVDGSIVEFEDVHTICVHGDTLNAVEIAKSLNRTFEVAGIELVSASRLV